MTYPIIKGNQHFDISLYSATGSAPQTITNSGGFKPDLVWTKPRSSIGENALNDSVRGASKLLITSSTGAEATDAQYVTSFNSNGFSLGTNNWSGTTVVGWQWKAGGTAVSNTAGSITSTVSANTTAGFSVVTFTATGSNATVGHGLGVAPKMIITKQRNTTGSWATYHESLGNTKLVYLNSTGAELGPSSAYWNNTSPTSSVFTFGGALASNNDTIVAYCFADVKGYSKLGSYTGNGSADGPFVYTGFRPRYIMIKRTDTSGFGWYIRDTARDTYNVGSNYLEANSSNAEGSGNVAYLDYLSNGFKLKNTAASDGINANSGTYIYMAFAETPFKYASAR